MLYLVFRKGICRHECGGVFEKEHLALTAARQLIQDEPDDHHRYEIVPFNVNTVTPRFHGTRYGIANNSLDELKPLYLISRDNGVVTTEAVK